MPISSTMKWYRGTRQQQRQDFTSKNEPLAKSQCARCSSCFISNFNLIRHGKMYHENSESSDSFSCSVCTNKYLNEILLKTHLFSHGAKTFRTYVRRQNKMIKLKNSEIRINPVNNSMLSQKARLEEENEEIVIESEEVFDTPKLVTNIDSNEIQDNSEAIFETPNYACEENENVAVDKTLAGNNSHATHGDSFSMDIIDERIDSSIFEHENKVNCSSAMIRDGATTSLDVVEIESSMIVEKDNETSQNVSNLKNASHDVTDALAILVDTSSRLSKIDENKVNLSENISESEKLSISPVESNSDFNEASLQNAVNPSGVTLTEREPDSIKHEISKPNENAFDEDIIHKTIEYQTSASSVPSDSNYLLSTDNSVVATDCSVISRYVNDNEETCTTEEITSYAKYEPKSGNSLATVMNEPIQISTTAAPFYDLAPSCNNTNELVNEMTSCGDKSCDTFSALDPNSSNVTGPNTEEASAMAQNCDDTHIMVQKRSNLDNIVEDFYEEERIVENNDAADSIVENNGGAVSIVELNSKADKAVENNIRTGVENINETVKIISHNTTELNTKNEEKTEVISENDKVFEQILNTNKVDVVRKIECSTAVTSDKGEVVTGEGLLTLEPASLDSVISTYTISQYMEQERRQH